MVLDFNTVENIINNKDDLMEVLDGIKEQQKRGKKEFVFNKDYNEQVCDILEKMGYDVRIFMDFRNGIHDTYVKI
jgi:hypothetical protein